MNHVSRRFAKLAKPSTGMNHVSTKLRSAIPFNNSYVPTSSTRRSLNSCAMSSLLQPRGALDDLLAKLDNDKARFLAEVQTAVRVYIESQKENCIAVVERGGGRFGADITHKPNMDDPIDFCKILYRFVRSKDLNGHQLESALTDPIVGIVEQKYAAFFQSHSTDVADALMKMLVQDKVVLEAFLGMVVDKIATELTAYARKQLVHSLMQHMHQNLSQTSHHMIAHQVTHLTAAATGQQVAIVVIHLLFKLVALNLKYLIAKLLATAAAKEVIFMLVKKYVAAAVLAAVVHFLAAHLGLATGASIMWVLLPIMVGIIAHQIYVFPEKLGKKVSVSVRDELSGNYRNVNEKAIQAIFDEAFKGDKLVGAMVGDKQFVSTVNLLVKKTQAG